LSRKRKCGDVTGVSPLSLERERRILVDLLITFCEKGMGEELVEKERVKGANQFQQIKTLTPKKGDSL